MMETAKALTARITVVLIIAAGGMALHAAASADTTSATKPEQSASTPVFLPGQPAKLHGNTPWG
ncbi:hypothetical protein ABGB17_25195 [Sphaerisporangium sp. B11E5]|uniref:hypothetical protein n=1 Tax=Sphaerisporangium sp. B11E5 TaxID=3153563 RepID=UPI00325D1302